MLNIVQIFFLMDINLIVQRLSLLGQTIQLF